MMKFKSLAILLASGAALVSATAASAQVTIADGTGYQAGIGPNGELFNSTPYIGLQNPAGNDYISPGTPRDSWGITGSTGSAYADQSFSGTAGITVTNVVSTASSATYTSILANGLTLTQYYTFFAPNILSIQETVTNSSAAAITDIVFRRNVDLDIPPIYFNENTVGVFGSNANVVANSYNGF